MNPRKTYFHSASGRNSAGIFSKWIDKRRARTRTLKQRMRPDGPSRLGYPILQVVVYDAVECLGKPSNFRRFDVRQIHTACLASMQSITDVTFRFAQHFDARLPAVEAAVRITSIYDAQVFTRCWVIRDKDRDLKALLRKLERANSATLIDQAMADFKQALSVRGLLPDATL